MVIFKKAVGILGCAFAMSFVTVPAYAAYPVCNVENCNLSYCHDHDGTTYQGHSLYDGHDYHQLCSYSDCTLTSSHDHDGATYMGHHAEDGHSYHNQGHHGRRHGGRHH